MPPGRGASIFSSQDSRAFRSAETLSMRSVFNGLPLRLSVGSLSQRLLPQENSSFSSFPSFGQTSEGQLHNSDPVYCSFAP